jgi:CBS domain containing-hemolysin-like protein
MSVLLLVLLLLLIAVNGFFVAAEFALVRSRRGKIEQAVEEGEAGAEAVVEQLPRWRSCSSRSSAAFRTASPRRSR